MNRLSQIYWTAKAVNWRNLPRRLLQAWRLRSGYLRRHLAPVRFADEQFRAYCGPSEQDQPALWAQRAQRLLPVPAASDLRFVADDETWQEHVLDVIEKALAGDYQMFSHWCGHVGWPPDFNLDPVHDIRWPVGEHWLRTARSTPPDRDLKLVWEASRFTLAYHLARAYARDGDERFAEAFWQMFDAWVEQNPPMLTVAWACGQEMTFRLMAMLTGAIVTLPSPAATPQRLYALSRLAWQTGRSIDANINQARMQGNNHAISEAVGLWSIGVLFPEFSQSERWKRKGRRALASEIAWQVYPDGSFVQHSMNYHRVMMDDLLWALALARASGEILPPVVLDRLERAAKWLCQMIDPISGRAPNYGANDGANVLPLSCQDYLDYRPTAQAAWQMLWGQRLFEPGPWDEKALWLIGNQSLAAPVKPPERPATWAAPNGGYYILRGPNSWAMIRCHSYRHRPNQCDMLHVDLWYQGINILRDAGSYSYCCEEPWDHYFHSTAAHNTVEIDGQDQMTKGPRFLWFRWTRGRFTGVRTERDGSACWLEGELAGHGESRDVIHRRGILQVNDTYAIVDTLWGKGMHHLAQRWRLSGAARKLGEDHFCVEGPAKLHLKLAAASQAAGLPSCGSESSPASAWESLYYARRSSCPMVMLAVACKLPTRFVTIISPDEDVTVSNWGNADETLRLVCPAFPGKQIRELTGGKVEVVS